MDIELKRINEFIQKHAQVESFDIEFDLLHCPQCACPKPQAPCKPYCANSTHWISNFYFPHDYIETYMRLVVLPGDPDFLEETVLQIQRDIPRTAPRCEYFNSPIGKTALERVLVAYAKYNRSTGYVQGMNFIVAGLLWHMAEPECFYVLAGLMDVYKLRDNYLEGMPGLYKHLHILEYCLIEQINGLYRVLNDCNLPLHVLCSDWVLTLFGNLIPLEQMEPVFALFFSESWYGFYKLALVILDRWTLHIDMRAPFESVIRLKNFENATNNWPHFLRQLKRHKKEKLDLTGLCNEAKNRVIPLRIIGCLEQNWVNRSSSPYNSCK